MKLLGNPLVVGGLCLVALGVVGYQFLGSRHPGAPAPAPVSSAPVPGASPARPSPAALPDRPAKPGTNATASATLIDRTYIESHLAEWTESSRRDLFRLVPAAAPGKPAISPVSRWKLKSIWQQTGSRLAVINNAIHSEGDVIEGYRLESIENDRVWFKGWTGRECLVFTNLSTVPAASAGTNSPNH